MKTTRRDLVTGVNEVVAAGTQRSKGVEFEGSWRATDALTLQATFSSVQARILYNGNATTDVGRRPAGVPDDQASFVVRYAFPGTMLEGLSFNAGVTYTGSAYPDSRSIDAAYKALNRLRKLLHDCVTNELARTNPQTREARHEPARS